MDAGTRDEVTARTLRHLLILVVDDEADVRRAVARLLQRYGFLVLEADCGARALEQMQAHPSICIVLLDQTMPNGSGPSFALRFRTQIPAVRLIVHSGEPMGEADRALVDDLIEKPAEARALVGIIDRWTAAQLKAAVPSLA